ncbi:insulinase family protein [Azospira restricta]|uniref:Insulinase family protein n=2 Tax=Azospira restricta TaxID=404405 RepID=A0A974Y5S5_9RHOO|nr:insulinase family protein [Azospira restricta]
MTRKLLLALGLCAATLAAEAGVRIEHWQAPSGARVYFVESRALPIVDVQVDFPAGAAQDPADKAGLAQLTRGLMDLGAGGMDENEVATKLADLGARLGGGADTDRASVSLRTLAMPDKRNAAFAIMRAVIAEPRFDAAVFERERARTVAALREALTRPETIAARAFWAGLYGDHPYGRQPTVDSLGRISGDDLCAFHAARYTARTAVVSIVGDLSRAEAEALAQQLTGALPAGEAAVPTPAVTLPAAGEVRLPHPAAQAHIQFGLPALKRGDPDFYALMVGNYSLGGGGFVSRLMKEVRDKRGFAYSVYSYFAPMKEAGPFQIGLQTKREQAKDALKVARDELLRFLAEGPSEDELKAAKANIVGSFPLRLDSNRKILDNVAAIAFYGLPLDYLDTYAANIGKVTAADVRAAFARHVKPEHLVTVVVAGE